MDETLTDTSTEPPDVSTTALTGGRQLRHRRQGTWEDDSIFCGITFAHQLSRVSDVDPGLQIP